MDIQAQIEQLEGFAGDSMGMEPGDRQILAEIKTTLEALNKVYVAADKMIDAMPNIQNIPVSYANPVRKVYAAIAEVQLLTDSGIRTPCTGLHDLRSKGDGTAYCRDCGETCDISETGAAETAYE